MFLYGMNIMADGLQKSAGGKMQKLMGFLTKNRLMAILVGAGVTAIIQSSSATTVMVVGFVNAGMLSLPRQWALSWAQISVLPLRHGLFP